MVHLVLVEALPPGPLDILSDSGSLGLKTMHGLLNMWNILSWYITDLNRFVIQSLQFDFDS